MKSYIGILGFIAGVALPAGAQTIGCTQPGVFVAHGRGDMAVMFTKMQVDSIFKGVQLTADQSQRAEEIVREAKVSSPAVAQLKDERHAKVMSDRNEKLRALVGENGDRTRVNANIQSMAASPNRCDIAR